MAENTNKVVTLETLGAAVQKIKQDYPTRTEVTEEISQELANAGGNVTYATEEEVLALFEDTTAADDGGEETT